MLSAQLGLLPRAPTVVVMATVALVDRVAVLAARAYCCPVSESHPALWLNRPAWVGAASKLAVLASHRRYSQWLRLKTHARSTTLTIYS